VTDVDMRAPQLMEAPRGLAEGTQKSHKRVLRMQQGSAQTLERVRWVSSVYQHLVARAGRIGATATDSAELALQKRLIVSLSAGLLPLTFLWSVIYFAAGAPLSAGIPGLYMIIAPINTAVFAWNRNLIVYRFVQLLIFLIFHGY
jgi:adenylate cyclase